MFSTDFEFLPVTTPSEVTDDLKNRTVTITGHRPTKLGGYGHSAERALVAFAVRWLTALEPRGAISGFAQGVDLAFAEAAVTLGIPLCAAIPCEGQSSPWPSAARRRYERLLAAATKTVLVTPGPYADGVMDARNHWMVDRAVLKSGILLAVWDGTWGGTRNCVEYAHSRRLPMLNTWSHFETLRRAA